MNQVFHAFIDLIIAFVCVDPLLDDLFETLVFVLHLESDLIDVLRHLLGQKLAQSDLFLRTFCFDCDDILNRVVVQIDKFGTEHVLALFEFNHRQGIVLESFNEGNNFVMQCYLRQSLFSRPFRPSSTLCTLSNIGTQEVWFNVV